MENLIVSRETLDFDFDQGGLKMIHLPSFISYLKLSWINRYFSNSTSSWQTILEYFNEYGGERVFQLQADKISEIGIKVNNPFWRDVLYSLASAKPKVTRTCTEDFLSLDIMNFIPCEEIRYYSAWKNYGVENICDIIDVTTKDFFTFVKIKDKIMSNNFMKYYSLLSRIPRYVKEYVRMNIGRIDLQNFRAEDPFLRSILAVKKAKFAYRNMRDAVFYAPTEKFVKWGNILELEILDFSKYFVL